MAKAIMVTAENRKEVLARVAEQNDLDDFTAEELEGKNYYLVMDFGGSSAYYGYLNQVAFDKGWVPTGQKLENGWFEVKRPS